MMVAGEFHYDREAEGEAFDAEETLSLSDLPITGDSSRWDYSYSRDEDDVDDDDGEDYFEFMSEDLTASTCASTIERDIIFCGKIINPYTEPPSNAKQSKTLNQSGDNSSVLLPRIPSKHTSKPATSRDSAFGKGRGLNDSRNFKNDYYTGRVSFMRSATKFGTSSMRLPAEMELSDIRRRQRRRDIPAKTKLPAPAGEEVVLSKSNQRRRNLWFGKMLRSLGLGCRNSKQANDVVKSFLSMNLPSVKTSTCWHRHVPRASHPY